MQTNDDVVDAAVSFDGTWAKKGFTYLTGYQTGHNCTLRPLSDCKWPAILQQCLLSLHQREVDQTVFQPENFT